MRFENSSGNWLSDGLNSVKFYLTMGDMACMQHGYMHLTKRHYKYAL